MSGLVRSTESLCPVCLSVVPAELVAQGEAVLLRGRCSTHGEWETVIWSGPPSFAEWCGAGAGTGGARPDRAAGEGPCPGSCGLCAGHEQHTCTALLEVTRRCDLGCAVCFAEASAEVTEADPSLGEMQAMLQGLIDAQGKVNLQLSGGEPTMRPDLPEVIRVSREVGFDFVQLNTNGLRLAAEAGYAEELREAGLASVFMQFDGVSDPVYEVLRGRPLLAHKLAALERCAQAGLAVVLVPTVVPGVNDQELGALVHLAAQWPGVVRGVHLQPISYFGRFAPGDRRRLTLPEVLRLLEAQTGGSVRVSDFTPSCCEHVRCSFRARYWVREGGALEPLHSQSSCCQPPPEGAARRAIQATSRQWGRSRAYATPEREGRAKDGLDRLLEDADRILCVSGMLFQDAWSLDLERIRRCCVHVLVPSRGLVPFCLWNLTDAAGRRLYPRV